MLDIKKAILNAVEYCYTSSNKDKTLSEIAENLKTQDSMLHSRFRHSIANDIAKYIMSCYGYAIKDIKLYGSTMEYKAGKYSDIDLIVRVERMGEEIRDSLKRLDYLLMHEYYLLIGEETDQYSYLIDAHIIDESLYAHDNSKEYLMYILNYDSIPLAV